MRTEIVTTFSADGAHAYGRRCVESVTSRWPHPMVVYADAPIAFDGVTVRMTADIRGWGETRDGLPSARQDAALSGTDRWTRKATSYLWNARQFAVKPFVWLDAAEQLGRGLLAWLDGDTVATSAVPVGAIEGLMGGADVAFLGRGAMHPETGFVAFRVPEALPVLRWCRDAYAIGSFKSWADGWTDCHALRAGLSALPVKARDLTSHTFTGEWNSSVDAFALSPIGPYVQHLKGHKRKREHAA